MPEQKLIVFIGSTREDLTEHRAAVRAVVTELGLFPEGMETWPVEDLTAVELCREKVKKSDIYIGIYAYRYGWQPSGFDNKSITELEYDWAGEKGIPRLCFVVDDNHPWAETKKDYKTKAELDAFKARVKERIVGFYGDPTDLKSKVAVALAKVIPTISTRKFVCDRVPKPALFAGRVKELAELKKALEGDQAVAITAVRGVGGIGKTTLAQQVAHEVGEKFGLKLWAALGQNFEESRVGDVLRDWAGEKYPLDWPLDRIIIETKSALTEAVGECGDGVLIVIDDVWKESVGSARKLLKAVPDGSRILITTRTEAVAAQMDARTQRLQHMPPNEGADLMLKHLENTDAAKYREKLEALSEVLGGHPLALKLAARQLRLNFTSRDLDDMIATMKKGLAAGEAFKNLELDGSDEKEDSVSVTLQQTLDRLGGDDAEKRALRQKQFRALGVLPPDVPFSDQYVAAVWGEEDRKGLRELIGEGLLEQAEIAYEGEWYIQHRLLRAYARGLVREQGELDEAFGRYADAVIGIAEQFKTLPPEEWGKLESDLPHVTAVGDTLVEMWKATPQDVELHVRALNFALRAYHYLHYRNEVRRLEWLEIGLEVSRKQDWIQHNALFLNEIGLYYLNKVGENQLALGSFEQALLLQRAVGNQSEEGTILNNIGLVWSVLGEHRKGLEYYEQALVLQRAVGNQRGEGLILNNIGKVYSQLNERQKALEYYEQALLLQRAVNDREFEAITLSNIGSVWSVFGEKRKALEYYEQARPLQQALGNKGGEGATLNRIGQMYDDLGERRKALEYYEQALLLRRAVGDKAGEGATLNNIGEVYRKLNEPEKALEYYEQALLLRRAVGDKAGEGATLNNIGIVHFSHREFEKAAEIFEQIIPVCRACNEVELEAAVVLNLAYSLQELNHLDQAIEQVRQSIEILNKLDTKRDAAGITLAQHEALLCELEAQKK